MSWNKSREEGRGKREEVRRVFRTRFSFPVLAGVVLVFAAAVAIFAVFRTSENRSDLSSEVRKPGRIAEAKPAPAPKTESPVPEAPARELTRREKARLQPTHTNMYGYVINPPPSSVVYTNSQASAMLSDAEKVFSNTAERKIAAILTLEPGETLVGDPSAMFGRGFRRKFLESLECPELVRDGDDEETRALKRAVTDAKADLKARMDAGEDVCEVMRQAYREAQEIGLYCENLKAEVSRLARDRTLSEEDVKDFVAAANKMLSDRGAKPLTMPRFAARRLQLMKERNKKEEVY